MTRLRTRPWPIAVALAGLIGPAATAGLAGAGCEGSRREAVAEGAGAGRTLGGGAGARTGGATTTEAEEEGPMFLEPPAREGKPQYLPAVDLRVGGRPLRAEVARTDAERARGLMWRRDLGADEGMLFCFPESEQRHFYMRNTPLPLSIAYIDERGVIREVLDLEPFDRRTVPSKDPVPFALEVHRGWFARHGIAAGDRLEGLEAIFRDPELTPR